MDKFKVRYLGHSAFLVEIDSCYLMFDYAGSTGDSGFNVNQANINFGDYIDKPLYMFGSHDHFDHYNRELHKKASSYDNIITILGDVESNFKNTVTMSPRESKRIGGVTIYTGASTDLGVCFLIDLGKFVIFHSGDNADWGDDNPMNKVYYEEINYFSNINLKVDLAFIPICNFFGDRPENMTKGAIYAIEKLNPEYVLPMHGGGNEYLYKDFAEDAKKFGIDNKIVCMKKIGDEF